MTWTKSSIQTAPPSWICNLSYMRPIVQGHQISRMWNLCRMFQYSPFVCGFWRSVFQYHGSPKHWAWVSLTSSRDSPSGLTGAIQVGPRDGLHLIIRPVQVPSNKHTKRPCYCATLSGTITHTWSVDTPTLCWWKVGRNQEHYHTTCQHLHTMEFPLILTNLCYR